MLDLYNIFSLQIRTSHTLPSDTDCGFLTILTQDSPGLEVKDPQTDEWKPVKVLENMFVVNLGDMAARWTNDAYKSTKHRVYNQNDSIRYSIPFFCNCNFEAPVKCILTDDDSCDKGNDRQMEVLNTRKQLLVLT